MQLLLKISETVGMMVFDLLDKITYSEFSLWAAWFELKNDVEKEHMADVKKQNSSKNPKIHRAL